VYVCGATRHVSPLGTSREPFATVATAARTIQAAIDGSERGDEILVHGGTYREALRLRRHGLRIRAVPGERVVVVAPLTVDGAPTDDSAVQVDPDAHGTSLQGIDIAGGFYGVSLETRWDWGEADRGGVRDVIIEDCTIHDTGRDCVKVKPGCDGTVIRRCRIHRSGRFYGTETPQDERNAEGIDNVNGDRMVVQNCHIHDTASTGCYVKGGATGCLVEATLVEDCGEAGLLLGFDTSPEFFDGQANPGMYESVDCTVRNCVVRRTGYAGIGIYASRNAGVVNNTVIDTARRGHAPLYFGLTLQDWDPDARRPASTGSSVFNNIVVQPAGSTTTVVAFRAMQHDRLGRLSSHVGRPFLDHNLYYVAGARSPRFRDDRPELQGRDGLDLDLAAWRRASGCDSHSRQTDPLLASGSGAPRPASSAAPVVDTGLSQQGMHEQRDFVGSPRLVGSAVDLGACEYTPSGPERTSP